MVILKIFGTAGNSREVILYFRKHSHRSQIIFCLYRGMKVFYTLKPSSQKYLTNYASTFKRSNRNLSYDTFPWSVFYTFNKWKKNCFSTSESNGVEWGIFYNLIE